MLDRDAAADAAIGRVDSPRVVQARATEESWDVGAEDKVLINSFVEDFQRDGRSVYHERRARFGPAWAWSEAGGWRPAASVTFAATPNGTAWGNHVEGGAVDAGSEAAPGTAYLATGGSAETGAGEEKLNLGRPLATLAPGSEPPALPADPTTVFTTACPISPPKSPFALSRTRH